ncbi:MAG: ABC transporter related protein [Parcubacteria group bacterium GW2011_GWA1_44_13]|uniref:ABC transporter related protein n=1 Tax=Candidatus Nomurabacteria bacterium GW2011_GWB1_44_12 TaxID=1618748 RepID=A0A837IJ61_9BACT|nr:MAG: ABC transporter related protein [Candidatus Nomurabacteria bacterium GW2011_GWB1_44_12]KKT38556.1 MAG: ABC transporter related protein [Parcubacteria group bacterium GW2011_GWA1_44_13]KKT60956.1 MAG: ABC transporter-related protein [Parcubacteria group bacterium GW2011_GWC1_44_26]HBB44446.1 ABC transporter ATP-binding protein [Candidatus Yonathbacteria bacterium]
MKSKYSNIQYPEVRIRDVVFSMWTGMSKGWGVLIAILLGIGGASAFEIVTPLYYKKFFDALTSSQSKAELVPQLIHYILVVLALNAAAWVCWRVGSYAIARVEALSMATLRQQAYDRLLYHSYSFFTDNFAGALVQRVGRYARAFERLTDRITWDIIPLIVRISGAVIITAYIFPMLAVIIFAWVVLYMVVNYFYSKWRLKYNLEMVQADSRTTAVLADAITNQNNIDIFSQHSNEQKYFKDVTEDQSKITLRNWTVGQGLDAIQAALIFLIEFAIFYVTIRYWEQGLVTVGTFILVQLYVLGLGRRLWDFGRIIRDFYEGFADAKEMVEIMNLPYEIKDVPTATPLNVSGGEVVFRNVTFAFNQTREVLKNINFTIKAGEKIAIVGPSGAGKTTFVRLLLRFYDVTSGKILIDGQDIRHATLKTLRNNVSLVPQDPLLFHRTIMENIRYGKPSATEAEVVEAARLAHCDEFINVLPNKYETYVGERGIKLSGGERQRVAIARAILKNAPILVLDEATSSLDSHSEALIQDALDTLMKGKTVVVVAHRLSTIRKMDRIIVLKDGTIIEEGTHDALTNQSGSLYSKLWDLQAGGFLRDGE